MTTRRHRRWLRWEWIPAVLYMAAIFAVSSISVSRVPVPRVSDKLLHFVEYAILAALLLFAVARTRSAWSRAGRSLAAWAIAAAYGITDELHQLFVPRRNASVLDWLADAAGAAFAVAVGLLLLRQKTEGTVAR